MMNAAADEPPDIISIAAGYAAHGFRVLPIAPGTKWPKMASWQHAASVEPQTHRNWWNGLYRGHGIGVATGRESGVWVLDIDQHGEHDGQAALDRLTAAHGALPATLTVRTGGGGTHYYFRYPTDLPDGAKIGTTSALQAGIDVRGDGGQVVAPPSIHPNGTAYTWAETGATKPANAPGWLLELVIVKPVTKTAAAALEPWTAPAAGQQVDSIADHIRNTHSFNEILTLDGWQRTGDKGSTSEWTRPGKTGGISALLHNDGSGPFNVFTTSVNALQQPWAIAGAGWSYSMFGYLAATRHNGDKSACARSYRLDLNTENMRAVSYEGAAVAHQILSGDSDSESPYVDWPTFWSKEKKEQNWLAEPFLVRGRSHALYAPGGVGKSLFSLWAAVQLSLGRKGLLGVNTEPTHVLYCDWEMTEDDLMERLEEMGYNSDTDLGHLHYAMIPSIDSLDTAAGGIALERMAVECTADLVIFDTFSRAVEGDENDADTTRAFYRNTGMRLKRRGIAMLRIDHAGKDSTKGQRGSSAKNDDVDFVWRMTAADGGFTLTAEKRRMSWVPETIKLLKQDDPYLSYSTTDTRLLRPGTRETMNDLDRLNAPVNITMRAAQKLLKDNDLSVRFGIVQDAVRQRVKRDEWDAEACVPEMGHIEPKRDTEAEQHVVNDKIARVPETTAEMEPKIAWDTSGQNVPLPAWDTAGTHGTHDTRGNHSHPPPPLGGGGGEPEATKETINETDPLGLL